MDRPLRWGIMGTGNIARQFATGVRQCRRGTLTTVASRTAAHAEAFAREYKIDKALAGYESLLDCADVDAVYISLPNTMHHSWTLRALRAGKHVLCEKPISVTAAEAIEMFAVAAECKRSLVEAFMYRCQPITAAIIAAVRAGEIGNLRTIRANFCFCTRHIEGNIRFNPALAGGSLMDVGCYCIDFSRLLAGCEPDRISGTAHIHSSGVDDSAVGYLGFPNGILASFTCGMTVQADNTAYLCGDEGFIEIPVPWKPPARGATYIVTQGIPPKMDRGPAASAPPRKVRTFDAGMDLYGVEADAFAATVLDGQPPAVMPQETIGNMTVLQELRRQVGLTY